jgi:hypothetical protein
MSTTVDALLPLSFLEAVRNVDSPDGDLDAEFVPELRNKRLGLSDTVYAQIKRYTDAARRKERPVFDEAVGLARLIGRRPDAEAVFRAAGRYLAMQTYLSIPAATRQMITVLPSILSRPIALRHVQRLVSHPRGHALGNPRQRPTGRRMRLLRGRAPGAFAAARRERRSRGPRALRGEGRGDVRVARRVALDR